MWMCVLHYLTGWCIKDSEPSLIVIERHISIIRAKPDNITQPVTIDIAQQPRMLADFPASGITESFNRHLRCIKSGPGRERHINALIAKANNVFHAVSVDINELAQVLFDPPAVCQAIGFGPGRRR